MERNQFKKRGMHELSFLDTLEEGIMNYTPIGVAINAFEGNGKKTNNYLLKPEEFVLNELNPLKIDKSGISFKTPAVVKDTEAAIKLIEQDIKWLGNEAIIGGNYVINGVETVGRDIYQGGRTIYKIGSSTVTFVENYYQFILFGIGSYLTARYVNELKQAVS